MLFRSFKGYIYIDNINDPIYFVQRPVGMKGDNIHYIRKPEDILPKLTELGIDIPSETAFETDALTYNEMIRLQKAFNITALNNANQLLREARAVKTDYEISLIKESGIKHAALYSHIPDVFHEGMSDQEMSIDLEYKSRLLGNLGMFRIFGSSMEIFMGSVIAGDNADNPSPYDFAMGGAGSNPTLPVGANGTILSPGITLMVDMGGNFTGYMTDMTRSYIINRINSDVAIKAHQCSIKIEKEIMKIARPGVEAKSLYELAIEIVKAEGLENYFMGHKQKAGFIGHGVGIEINEIPVIAPKSKDILEEGMVFALEPKFVIPGIGAVGNENTFVVRDSELEKVTIFEEGLTVLED